VQGAFFSQQYVNKQNNLQTETQNILCLFVCLFVCLCVFFFGFDCQAFLSAPAPYGKVYVGSGKETDDPNDQSFALGGIIGGAMNSVQILIMNNVYGVRSSSSSKSSSSGSGSCSVTNKVQVVRTGRTTNGQIHRCPNTFFHLIVYSSSSSSSSSPSSSSPLSSLSFFFPFSHTF
jgi:hypothetical protein